MTLAQAKSTEDNILTSGDVARRLGVTPAAVRQWVRNGRIVPARSTTSGIHLFGTDEVERLRAERKKAGARAR